MILSRSPKTVVELVNCFRQTEERWDARWLGRAAVGGGGAVGDCRQSKGLISPWLMVQIHSSPPAEIMTNSSAIRGKLLVTFLFVTKGFAGPV